MTDVKRNLKRDLIAIMTLSIILGIILGISIGYDAGYNAGSTKGYSVCQRIIDEAQNKSLMINTKNLLWTNEPILYKYPLGMVCEEGIIKVYLNKTC
jgi:hypothetical protein